MYVDKSVCVDLCFSVGVLIDHPYLSVFPRGDAVAISFKLRGITMEPLSQAKALMKACHCEG